MSGQGPPFDSSQRERIIAQGPPYPPFTQGLGGQPESIPDVPITAILLVIYLIFGIIHIKILKSNKGRGHKFIFNGAILGLCKIRIVTMSLRMAWAYHPRNVSLGIAANTFVYVGTIILFGVNWFFVQRVVRAQHQRLGWSTAYRIFHRAALVLLVSSLILIVLGNIWTFFTINEETRRVLRSLQIAGQTYFAVFCFAPAVLVLISVLIPRREIEKFGAGRLRINITILLIAVTVLTIGQVFRCVITWLPQTPVRDSAGQPIEAPWYLHKACFYIFNFGTEIIVIVMFALVRVDLRFHVPNGSRMSGDYSGRNSRVNLNSSIHLSSTTNLSTTASKKSLACESPITPMTHRNDSSTTLHHYPTSIFEDSHTLADSLKFGSSTLEIDSKTGTWKVKRISTGSVASSTRGSTTSSLQDRTVTFATTDSAAPPVPSVPSDWPLPPSTTHKQRYYHAKGGPKATFDDMGTAISSALASLEHNSEKNTSQLISSPNAKDKYPATPPPAYREKSAAPPIQSAARRATFPPKSALKTRHAAGVERPTPTPTIVEAPERPVRLRQMSAKVEEPVVREGSVEFVMVGRGKGGNRGVGDGGMVDGGSGQGVTRAASSMYSQNGSEGSRVREEGDGDGDRRRFSFEEVSPVEEGWRGV